MSFNWLCVFYVTLQIDWLQKMNVSTPPTPSVGCCAALLKASLLMSCQVLSVRQMDTYLIIRLRPRAVHPLQMPHLNTSSPLFLRWPMTPLLWEASFIIRLITAELQRRAQTLASEQLVAQCGCVWETRIKTRRVETKWGICLNIVLRLLSNRGSCLVLIWQPEPYFWFQSSGQ